MQHQVKKIPYTHKPALDLKVQKYVKPIYESLTDENLLKRCLGRNTQNNNESYSCLWQLVPSIRYASKI